MPLAMVIRMAVRFFTTTATCLLPVVTTLSPWGKWGPSPPFNVWVITCMLLLRSKVFVGPCIILDKKASTSSLLVDCFIQISGINCWRSSSITFDRKLCSMTSQQPGYPQSIQRSWQPIYLTFLDCINNLIDGWGTKNNQYLGPKGGRIWFDWGHLIFVIASDSFHLNPYDNIAQRSGVYSSKTIYTQGTIWQVTQRTNIQRMNVNRFWSY